ncbi:hypothetical protein crov271 [Cafeteria roenbergensis virus]|uniref:Glycosyltransferase n=1 Tax=Cafeteria roenbergensis virus (strain BV-PW1) TaxID=693272 RepID=E3T541_CROVB|nr:hypothetical protein crov271 [Cafeteria roenbergensis virus BV-PW1]ADO67304.1 hypothetical protein crov271 [Cafeteria roenbergensis virus BV-PW1]
MEYLPIITEINNININTNKILKIEDGYVLNKYKPKSNLTFYLKQLYKNNNNYIKLFNGINLKNSNFIDIDFNFCKHANLLDINLNNYELFEWLISSKGFYSGIIFHPNQLVNLYTNIEFYEDSHNNLLVKHNTKYYYLSDFSEMIYNRNLDSFLNDFKIIQFPVNYKSFEILIILFWGNNDIGTEILKKIKLFKFKYNLLIVKKTGINYNFNNKYFVIETNEYGNDIIPTIIGFNFANTFLNFNYILKLQTKSDIKWRNPLINFFLNKSKTDLINLLDNQEFICHPKFISKITSTLINKLFLQNLNWNDKSFPAGSIYFCKKHKFDNMIKFINYSSPHKYFIQTMYDTHYVLRGNSSVHFLERLVGINLDKHIFTTSSNYKKLTINQLKNIVFFLEQSKKEINKNIIKYTKVKKVIHPRPNLIYKNKLNQINKKIKYYQNVTHCYGWNRIITELKNNLDTKNILIIDNIEQFFNDNQTVKIDIPWIGFIHCPETVPIFLSNKYINLSNILNNKNFISSLNECSGIISFNTNICNQLSYKLPNINIYNFYHPISFPLDIINNYKFTTYKLPNLDNLVFLGQHLRKNYLMFKFIDNFNVSWLPGIKNDELNCRKKITEYEAIIKHINIDWNKIKIHYFENKNEYFEMLKKNIIILSFYACNANNSILDIISLKIPALIEKNTQVETYLGKDYPGYFEEKNLDNLLNNKIKLEEILNLSYQYLNNNHNYFLEKLSLNKFINSCKYIINGLNLSYIEMKNGNIFKFNDKNKIDLIEGLIDNKGTIIEYCGNKHLNVDSFKINNIILENNKVVGLIKYKNQNLYSI